MPKAAYCSECASYVWVGKDGGCVSGHPRSCLRGEYEATQNPVTAGPSSPAPALQDVVSPTEPRDAMTALSRGVWSYVGAIGQHLESKAVALRADASQPLTPSADVSSTDPPQTLVDATGPAMPTPPLAPATGVATLTVSGENSPRGGAGIRAGWDSGGHIWLPARAWLAGFIYWMVATGGASAVAAAGGNGGAESGWVILAMLAMATLCMITSWRTWTIAQRIGFVFATWIAHAVITAVVGLPIAFLMVAADRIQLADRAVSLTASLPIVLFAMRQSRLFTQLRLGA